jgi:hypothetical protein
MLKQTEKRMSLTKIDCILHTNLFYSNGFKEPALAAYDLALAQVKFDLAILDVSQDAEAYAEDVANYKAYEEQLQEEREQAESDFITEEIRTELEKGSDPKLLNLFYTDAQMAIATQE